MLRRTPFPIHTENLLLLFLMLLLLVVVVSGMIMMAVVSIIVAQMLKFLCEQLAQRACTHLLFLLLLPAGSIAVVKRMKIAEVEEVNDDGPDEHRGGGEQRRHGRFF